MTPSIESPQSDFGKRPSVRYASLVLGIVLSAIGLYFVGDKIDLATLKATLGAVQLRDVMVACLFPTAILMIRSLRWVIELKSVQKTSFRWVPLILPMGLFINSLLPLKLGEWIRSDLVARYHSKVRFGSVLGVIAVEKLIDLLFTSIALAATSFLVGYPNWIPGGASLLSLLPIIGLASLGSIKFRRGLLKSLREEPVHDRLQGFFTNGVRGFRFLSMPRTLAFVVMLTFGTWVLEAGMMLAISSPLGVELTVLESLSVVLFLAIGGLIPSAPAQIGTHQALMTLVLGFFGVEPSTAVALSILFQSVKLGLLGSFAGLGSLGLLFVKPRNERSTSSR